MAREEARKAKLERRESEELSKREADRAEDEKIDAQNLEKKLSGGAEKQVGWCLWIGVDW